MKLSSNSVIRTGAVLVAFFASFTAIQASDSPVLAKTKFQTVEPAVLAKYDTDKDLVLNEKETALMEADLSSKKALAEAKHLKKFDTNKDGKLDESELAAEVALKAEKKATAAEKRAAKKADKAVQSADQIADKVPSSK